MSLRRRVVAIAACAILSVLVSPAGVRAQGAPSTFLLERLIFETEDGGGGVLRVLMSGPGQTFSCMLPQLADREVVLDVPGAGTELPSRVDLKNDLAPEAIVEKATPGGPGVRLRLTLGQGKLSRIEQAGKMLLLHFSRSSSDYRVGVGDKLDLTVFGHDDMSKSVEVRADGTISVPLIGETHVAGKTVVEIAAELTAILGKDYLVDPQVTVDVREYQSQWVTIMGEVKTPGKYVLKRNMRLIDILAESGGPTKEAGSRIVLTRPEAGGAPKQIVVDRDLLVSRENTDSNLLLQHGDIIAVAEKEVFYIRGEVNKPGAYLLDSGMTVLKAISLAGGFTQFANRKQLDLLSADGGGVHKKIHVNIKAIEDGKSPDQALGPNDTIIVPRRIF